MKIVDLYGKEITVTELNLALMQADDYRHYRHIDPAFNRVDEGLIGYWEDIYQKLLLLQRNKSRAKPPLATFIRNRRFGVLGRLTLKIPTAAHGHRFLKYRPIYKLNALNKPLFDQLVSQMLKLKFGFLWRCT